MAGSRKRGAVGWKTAARWTAAMASDALGELKSSGQSIPEFASTQGLDAQRLYGWRRRLAATAERVPSFIEVISRPTRQDGSAVEIVMPTGEVVRVGAGFDDTTVARVVALLRAGRC